MTGRRPKWWQQVIIVILLVLLAVLSLLFYEPPRYYLSIAVSLMLSLFDLDPSYQNMILLVMLVSLGLWAVYVLGIVVYELWWKHRGRKRQDADVCEFTPYKPSEQEDRQ